MRWVACLCALASAVMATPVPNFAFNSQLPPVARYGEAYSYTLNSNTFSSAERITYSMPDLPSWLQFDAPSATISGTPPASDSGNGDQLLKFTLLAADSTGTTSMGCTLQLTNTKMPSVQPISELQTVLAAAGPLANNVSLVLSPGQQFTIEFPQNYFTSDGRSIVGHYSVTSDHAPLPIWLQFDGAQGKFWGSAPSVTSGIAPAQQFDILYIVSTYEGFASASSKFSLLLGAHAFATSLTTDKVNVTAGEFFQYEIPFNQITLNGEPVTKSNVSQVNVTLPGGDAPWVQYNDQNSTIYGTPDTKNANDTINVPIEVWDRYGDSVQFSLEMSVLAKSNDSIFSTSTWRPINVTAGEYFQYSIEDYVINKDAKISMDAHGADWLHFQSSNYTMNGVAPDDFNGTNVDFTASLPNSESTLSRASLALVGVGSKSKLSPSSSASASSSATASSTSTASGSESSGSSAASTAGATNKGKGLSKGKKLAIGLGVGIPLAVLAILAVLLFCCCRKRRRNAGAASDNERRPGGPVAHSPGGAAVSPANVSDPIPPAEGVLTAPVFKTVSQTDTEGTFVETPEMKNDNPADWTTPHRVSAYNFMRMDDGDVEDTMAAGAGTGAGVGAGAGAGTGATQQPMATTINSPQAPPRAAGRPTTGTAVAEAGAAALGAAGAVGAAAATAGPRVTGTGRGAVELAVAGAPAKKVDPNTIHQRTMRNATPVLVTGGGGATSRAAQQSEEYSNVPRESWRHTNLTDRRWQDARISYNSQASISDDEPATMQLASAEFGSNRDIAGQNGQSTPRRMPRDESSGIVHYLTSDVSSPDHYDNDPTPRMPDNGGRFDAIPESDSASEKSTDHYLTASSGDEGSPRGQLDMRPYRDDQGHVQWNRTPDYRTDSADDNKVRAKLVDRPSINRKPSKVGNVAPEGEAGELAFV